MKKKCIRVLITLSAIAVVLTFVWPLSFTALLATDTPLIVCCNEWRITEDGMPEIDEHTYTLAPDSQAYAQIREILSRFSYRRCIRTFVGDNVLEGKNPGYSLQLYSGENGICFGGTGEIDVNARIHRMGLFGSGRAEQLMSEVIAVLETVPEYDGEANGGENT